MPYPPTATIPGTQLLTLGVETPIAQFEAIPAQHYQITVSLNQFVSGESIEFRFYTKRPQDGLFYQEGLPQTFAGQVGGGGPQGQKHFTVDFRAGIGVKITGLQTGGTARTVDWFAIRV